ncbi:MAG: T9SS type A sorting domain-containing protein, partial [Aeriscardovia sp.]|nr:T9SS type A sorting domain-containing protein [Aeriscardovia sp.]
ASTSGEMMSRTSLFSGGGIQDETANVGQVSSVPFNGASLMQNTPNPFSERTVIRFTLPENAQNAYIYIFDMQGKMQKQIPVNASMQSVTVNGYELSAGMYIYSLVVNGKEVDTKRMILSK